MAEVKTETKLPNRIKATAAVGEAVEAYYRKCWADKEKGIKCAWGEGIGYFPLIRAAGVNYIFADAQSARLGAKKFLTAKEAAADMGFLEETCSYSRYHIGACRIVKGDYPYDKDKWDLKKLIAPPADMYFNTDACSAGNLWGEMLRRYAGIPTFTVHTRRMFDESEYKDEQAHVVAQLKDMIKFLEQQTGKPYDYDALKKIMTNLKLAAVQRSKFIDLMKHKPAPMTYFDVLATYACFTILHGRDEAPKLLEGVVKECEDRIARGESGVPHEKYRLYFMGAMNWARLGWLAKKFAEYDVTVIGGTYDHMMYPWPDEIDPEHPLESLSFQPISCGYVLAHDLAAERCDWRLCKDWDIDGIIIHEAHTCRMQSGSNKDRVDYVARRLGVPVVAFQSDFVEEAFFNEAQFETRLQGLLEVIDAKRRGK